MNLPYDYSRCVGVTDWRTKEAGKPERLHELCNACRRREPGHPERQVYMKAALVEELGGHCDNRIEPVA